MAVLLFTRPDLFRTVVGSVVAFGVLLALALAATLGWALLAPEAAARAGIKVHRAPSPGFVGSEGFGSRLRIVDGAGGRLRVEWSRSNYVFVLVLLAAAGPGLGLLLAVRQAAHPVPMPFLAALSMFAVACSALFVSWAITASRKRPALEVARDAVTLLRGSQVERRIVQRDIDGLRIEPHTYVSRDSRGATNHPNFILTARLADGSDVRLCISDDRAQIEALMAKIRSRMFLGPDRGPI